MKNVYRSYFGRDPDPRWSWPRDIAERFEAHSMMGMSAGYYFEPDSPDHSEFLALVGRLRLDIFAEDLICVSGPQVSDYPFYRLTVQVDNEYEKPDYMNWRSRCPGDDRTLCVAGGLQQTKVVLDPAKSKPLDIVELPERINPHVYIVSRRLKEALEEHELTGMRLVPVIDSGARFSEADLALDAESPDLESRASRFQLIATARPEALPRIGNVSIRRRCEACGTVYLYLGGGTPYFERGTLAAADFQLYRGYQSENEGVFDIAGDACIVSAGFLKLMNDHRFTGLADYSKKPRTPYGVVRER